MGQTAQPDDPQASLRTELLGQIAGAQIALDRTIAELPSLASGEASHQLANLSALARQVATADLASLLTLKAEVAAALSFGRDAMEQARSATTIRENAEEVLANAGRECRATIAEIMHGMRDFEPYLQFASPEEEAAYRKGAEDRQAYIADQLAKNTPQGELNAANAALDQLRDAGAHGADRHPEYQDRLSQMTQSRDKLRDAIAMTAVPEQPRAAPTQEAVGQEEAASDDLAAVMAALRDSGVRPAEVADNSEAGMALSAKVAVRDVTSGRA